MEATYRNRKHKVYEIEAFGNKYNVIVSDEKLRPHGDRCLMVWTVIDGVVVEPFAELTKVVSVKPQDGCCFVKNYSENEEWADKLAVSIGGKPTGRFYISEFVELPEYNFKDLDIYGQEL